MVHPGRGIFGSDFGTTIFVIAKRRIKNYISSYRRLFEKQGEVVSIEAREQTFLSGKGAFSANQENFSKIPGSPIAYWVSNSIQDAFQNSPTFSEYVVSFQGIITGDNDKFLRQWFELNHHTIAFDYEKISDIQFSESYWIPYNKGGEYRKWYGNQDYVVNWKNGPDDKTRGKKTFEQYYLKEYVSWSYITSGSFATRYFPQGFLWDVHGSGYFDKTGYLYYLQGFLNSKVGNSILDIINPTISYQVENILLLPIIESENKSKVEEKVKDAISLAKTDWDSFETSWNFKKHPLI